MSEATKSAQTRFFAILMPWGRVGSNLVTATLAELSDIVIDNEPTTRLKTYGLRDGLSPAEIGKQQLQHLLSFHQAHLDTGGVAVLKLSHRSLIDPQTYAQHLHRLGFRPIIMLRENFLKCAVSQLRATAREQAPPEAAKHWQSPWAVARTEPKPGPVPIDPAIAIQLTREFQDHHEALLRTAAIFGEGTMRIEYRELAADPAATIRKIYAAFGLAPPPQIRLAHRKATSKVLGDDIPNYDQFAKAVRKAGLERFLGDND